MKENNTDSSIRIYPTIQDADTACIQYINLRMGRAISLASILSDAFMQVIRNRNPELAENVNPEEFKLNYFYYVIKSEVIPIYSSYLRSPTFLALRLSKFPSEADKDNAYIMDQIKSNTELIEEELKYWVQYSEEQSSTLNSYMKELVTKVKDKLHNSFEDDKFETLVEYMAGLAKYLVNVDGYIMVPYVYKDSSSEINGYEFAAMLIYFIDCCYDNKVNPSEWWFTDSDARAKRYLFTPEDLVILDAFFLAWGKKNEPKENK